MKNKIGTFITFEGPEASGKSSQIILLKQYLLEKSIPFIITREPGGTIIAEKLRKIILDHSSNISNFEEILLLMASRYNHVNNVILPNLKKGKIVISDRFVDSTFVYQGIVNKYGIKKIKKLHKELLNNFLPDYTLVFNLSPKEVVRRLKKRKVKNKYDKNDILFHKKVINAYKSISKTKRHIMINAEQSKNEIHSNIKDCLNLK